MFRPPGFDGDDGNETALYNALQRVHRSEPLVFSDAVKQAQFVTRIQDIARNITRDTSLMFQREYFAVMEMDDYSKKPEVLEAVNDHKGAAYLNLLLSLKAICMREYHTMHMLDLVRCATNYDNTVVNLGVSNSLLIWSLRYLLNAMSPYSNPSTRKIIAFVCNKVGDYAGKMGEHRVAASYYLYGANSMTLKNQKAAFLVRAGTAFGWAGDYVRAYDYFTRATTQAKANANASSVDTSLILTSRLCCIYALYPLSFDAFCTTIGADREAFDQAMKNTCTCMSTPSCSTLPMWFVKWMKTKEEADNGAVKAKCDGAHRPPPTPLYPTATNTNNANAAGGNNS